MKDLKSNTQVRLILFDVYIFFTAIIHIKTVSWKILRMRIIVSLSPYSE